MYSILFWNVNISTSCSHRLCFDSENQWNKYFVNIHKPCISSLFQFYVQQQSMWISLQDISYKHCKTSYKHCWVYSTCTAELQRWVNEFHGTTLNKRRLVLPLHCNHMDTATVFVGQVWNYNVKNCIYVSQNMDKIIQKKISRRFPTPRKVHDVQLRICLTWQDNVRK